ncbi:amidase [Limobrevibacterium gyesilva]|uniref:Amidase n=1 Tax=Limobrevibacterium gyesilva TaxID=2991712 RepID=A0AA42CD57_9PROT|nr:amidase [Limobrevibacterium gyesilva]MCW3474453.1 amidase [Limobrevibacterium gyesilva]
MTPEEYRQHDATGLAALVRRRAVSAEDVLDAMIARAEAVNGTLNAIVLERYDAARAAIRAGLPDGPFTGVPYFIKDLHAPAIGLPLSHASRLFAGTDPGFDSETIARLRRAGFVLAGRTNSPEFGMSASTEPRLHGPTRNPWSPAHSPGGSSGGAGAAVAGGIVPAAHATDSLGSIRIPASCCGLVGLKPTRGRNPVGPHRGDAMMGLSHEHCVSRSVRDSAAILDATAGPDEGAPWFTAPPAVPFAAEVGRDPGRLRIGVVTESWTGVGVHPDCVAAVQHAAQQCAALGHEIVPTRIAVDGAALFEACNTILLSGLAGLVRMRERELGRPAAPDELEPLTRACVARWESTPAVALHGANARINAIVRQAARQFRAFDVILTPMLARPPALLGELTTDTEDTDAYLRQLSDYAAFTPLFSATGQPAMNLPLFRNADGLPIGVQAVAKFADDAVLFRLAAQLEPGFIGLPVDR